MKFCNTHAEKHKCVVKIGIYWKKPFFVIFNIPLTFWSRHEVKILHLGCTVSKEIFKCPIINYPHIMYSHRWSSDSILSLIMRSIYHIFVSVLNMSWKGRILISSYKKWLTNFLFRYISPLEVIRHNERINTYTIYPTTSVGDSTEVLNF